jgi:hypothetical protein
MGYVNNRVVDYPTYYLELCFYMGADVLSILLDIYLGYIVYKLKDRKRQLTVIQNLEALFNGPAGIVFLSCLFSIVVLSMKAAQGDPISYYYE